MRYGLVGEKLGHSFSKEIHEQLADYSYQLFSLNRQQFHQFFTQKDFAAVNVTIPYKQDVMSYLDHIDPRALEIGAVNTVVNRDGKLYGYNTDFDGFMALLDFAGIDPKGKKVLVLGSGGTSKTACAVLNHMGAAQVQVVSRNPARGQLDYKQAQSFGADILVNTTPVGMFPNCRGSAVNLNDYPTVTAVADVVYNPLRTDLVLQARQKGLKAVGGLYMLVAQAVYAAGHFLQQNPQIGKIETIYKDLVLQKTNLVLTGMPGAGKSTVGALLAKMCGKSLTDTDSRIVQQQGVSIPEIFEQVGESGFRDIEQQVTAQVAAQNGQVISTGGGVILRDDNIRALRQNGVVVFLDRPLQDLTPGGGRPLSSTREALEKRYQERYEKYNSLSDIQIVNKIDAETCAKQVLEAFYETACDQRAKP